MVAGGYGIESAGASTVALLCCFVSGGQALFAYHGNGSRVKLRLHLCSFALTFLTFVSELDPDSVYKILPPWFSVIAWATICCLLYFSAYLFLTSHFEESYAEINVVPPKSLWRTLVVAVVIFCVSLEISTILQFLLRKLIFRVIADVGLLVSLIFVIIGSLSGYLSLRKDPENSQRSQEIALKSSGFQCVLFVSVAGLFVTSIGLLMVDISNASDAPVYRSADTYHFKWLLLPVLLGWILSTWWSWNRTFTQSAKLISQTADDLSSSGPHVIHATPSISSVQLSQISLSESPSPLGLSRSLFIDTVDRRLHAPIQITEETEMEDLSVSSPIITEC